MTPDVEPAEGCFACANEGRRLGANRLRKGGDGNERNCFKTASAMRKWNERRAEDELVDGKHGQRGKEFEVRGV